MRPVWIPVFACLILTQPTVFAGAAQAGTAPQDAAATTAPDRLLEEATDLTGNIMFMESGAPGMVMVVVRGDQHLVLGYGETAKGNSKVPDGQSLFRLNSLTKVFAGEVLVAMENAGKVSLTAPLSAYAPGGFHGSDVPRFGQRDMTLLDLATHSSGLPREIGEAPPNAPPRTWPTLEDRWKWLATYQLPWAPGTVTSYSNVAFDFLADALADAGKEPYPLALQRYVTGPLGMADTVFTPNAAECDRLMEGSGLGGVGPCVDTTASIGSGGLYSTGDDMARWLQHLVSSDDATATLDQAVYRQRQTMPAAIGFDEAGPMMGLGLGWVMIAPQGAMPALIQKSGGGVGFMTYVVFAPGRHVGVFVAVSKADFAMFAGLSASANELVSTLATR